MNTLRRTLAALSTLALLVSLGFWNLASAQSFPEKISLPEGFWPEGIAIGDGPTAYVGSAWTGSIYEVDLRTGSGSILVPGPLGPYITVGMDFDQRSGYLFVAGGFSGNGRVYDTTTGTLIDSLLFGGGWINDVVLTQDAAYFTDSLAPFIYKVPLDSHGAQSDGVVFLPLGGEWDQQPTMDLANPIINANGIVATPDKDTLIVVNYVLGRLYNVDPDTGYATEIDLGGVTVPFGDGLVLRGKTLYVVQNFENAIAVFTLSPDYSTATFMGYLRDPDLRTPATAGLFGPWLYTTNPRFDVCIPLICDPSSLNFEIVRVEQ
jgi:DNA-binding beta-propeller fold protein YncE